jgi:hypothetical protein
LAAWAGTPADARNAAKAAVPAKVAQLKFLRIDLKNNGSTYFTSASSEVSFK